MNGHNHDPIAYAQRKKDRDDLKTLPPGNSNAALKARVEQLEKILGLR